MTNRSNEDIANALRGLASGEHAESETGAQDASIPAPAPAATPPRAPPPPTGQPPFAPPKSTVAARPARPILPGATPAPQRSAVPGAPAPARPASPVARPSPSPAPPYVVPATSAVPHVTAPPQAAAISPGSLVPAAFIGVAQPPPTSGADFVRAEPAASFDDDDAMSMPAPSMEYLGHAPHIIAHPKRTPGRASSGLRSTLIPVLITTAALMMAAAVLRFIVHPDAPLSAMPVWLALVLAGGGVAFIAVAVMYVIQGRVKARAVGGGDGSGLPPT